MTKKYHVALSYASEEREYVAEVANFLKAFNVRCFYDKDEEISLWGNNILEVLQQVFADGQSYFVVIFISQQYASKAFPRQELEHALSTAISQKQEYILPARFDDTKVPGLSSLTTYIDIKGKTPEEFAVMIIEKITEKGIYLGPHTLAEEIECQTISKKNDSEVTMTIKDETENLIAGADVYLIHSNGTHRPNKSNEIGEVAFSFDKNIFYTIFVAHQNFLAGIVDNFQCETDIEVKLKRKNGMGSMIFSRSMGHIPGIQGILNPKLGSSRRSYLYAENISVNNNSPQPAYFQFGENISLEDSVGNTADIRIHRIIQRCVILDYITHR